MMSELEIFCKLVFVDEKGKESKLAKMAFEKEYMELYDRYAVEFNKHIDGWNKAFDIHKPDWDGDYEDSNGLYMRFMCERANSIAGVLKSHSKLIKRCFVRNDLGFGIETITGQKLVGVFKEIAI